MDPPESRPKLSLRTSHVNLPFASTSPDELSPRTLRSSLRDRTWLANLVHRTEINASTSFQEPIRSSRLLPSTRRKRSLSNPNLKDVKKDVDLQLSAFITFVANLEVKKEIEDRARRLDAEGELFDNCLPLSLEEEEEERDLHLLHKLKLIAQTFVDTPSDELHSRDIVRQIQKLHLNTKAATPLERELMIKLLFIVSSCARCEEYKVLFPPPPQYKETIVVRSSLWPLQLT